MLEFREVRAGYDGVEKLHGISVRLERGCLTAIIGPNGCGKSTLLKCGAGLLKPSGGEILLSGGAMGRIGEKERARRISYMPQSRVAPDISVLQLAAHGRYPYLKWGRNLSAADRQIVSDAVERTGLARYAQRAVSRLSGGERQRAYLAMMLAQQTEMMLLDEPTTYLDLSSQFELMELLRALRDEGRSIAVVLHDLSLALEYADAIVLMEGGRLIAAGKPAEVYASGALERCFGVEIRRTEDEKYIFYAAGDLAGQEERP